MMEAGSYIVINACKFNTIFITINQPIW